MPRLSCNDSDEGRPLTDEGRGGGGSLFPRRGRNRGATSAYAASGNNRNGVTVFRVVIILTLTLVLRNIFFHDYREEAIEGLRASGKTSDEIDAYIPKTMEERQKKDNELSTSLIQMKEDIDFLKREVGELRQAFGNIRSESAALKSNAKVEQKRVNSPAK